MVKYLNEKDLLTLITVGSRFLSQVPEHKGRNWGKKCTFHHRRRSSLRQPEEY